MNRVLKLTLKDNTTCVFLESSLIYFIFNKDTKKASVTLNDKIYLSFSDVIECIFE